MSLIHLFFDTYYIYVINHKETIMNVIELLKKAIKESKTLTVRTMEEDHFCWDAGGLASILNIRLSQWLMHRGHDTSIWEFENGTIIHVQIDEGYGREHLEIYELTPTIVEEVELDREIVDGIVVEDGESMYRPAANYLEVLDYMGNSYNEWVLEIDPLMFGMECELDEPYNGPKILSHRLVTGSDYSEGIPNDED